MEVATMTMMNGIGPSTTTGASREITDQFFSALAARDFATLATCFAADVRFRALLPSGLHEAATPDASARYFHDWFGAGDRLEVLDRRFEAIVDRHHLAWRSRVHRDGQWLVIEQQAFATIRDGRFVQFDLLCSGFRPEDPTVTRATHLDENADPLVAAVLEGGEASCATLTPLIKAKLGELASGQVLEIVTSEPTAERDIASWSSLTGNALVGKRSSGSSQHFYVRKK
jgi:tRNA 2-thiouridine synthesizing protein A